VAKESPAQAAADQRCVADAIVGCRGGRRMKAITRSAAAENRTVTWVPVASAPPARSSTASAAVLARRGCLPRLRVAAPFASKRQRRCAWPAQHRAVA